MVKKNFIEFLKLSINIDFGAFLLFFLLQDLVTFGDKCEKLFTTKNASMQDRNFYMEIAITTKY